MTRDQDTDIDWPAALADQLDWHWQRQLRPRLDGLGDDEYFWEPVPNSWSIRRRGTAASPTPMGAGDFVMDDAAAEPEVPPVTTIAWRLAHVIVGCLARPAAVEFGGPPADFDDFEYAGTAARALEQLDGAYARWMGGVRGLDAAALARPCGLAYGPYAHVPVAGLVLHYHREIIHHGAEIALLRDLYRSRSARQEVTGHAV